MFCLRQAPAPGITTKGRIAGLSVLIKGERSVTVTWGLDLGVTSVGSAVIRWNEPADKAEILHLGVRIFPEAREAGTKKEPRNLARRNARLARRSLRRRRWRRVHLREILAKEGLLPTPDSEPPKQHDPYSLRARALKEPLPPHELGWAILHLLKRRGFMGSRKRPGSADDTAQKEEQEAESRGQSLAKRLDGKTLGQHLSAMAEPARRRGAGQTRAMVVDELDRIWCAQQPHHPKILTDQLRQRIDDIALYQRPTYFRRRSFGECDLEAGEPRALKADWLTQHVEMLQLVNALRVEGGNNRPLDPGERELARAYLEQALAPTWARLRAAVGLRRTDRFTHERGKGETVRGNATEAKLRAAVGPEFPRMPAADAIREQIGALWHAIEYHPAKGGGILEIRDAAGIAAARQRLATYARDAWQLSPEHAEALAAIDLPDGTARHSLRAMLRLRPHLEAGMPYMTALDAEYGRPPSGQPIARLPGPNSSEISARRIADPFVLQEMRKLLAGLRNPTVLRALGELQKVVNALLRAYGRPDTIRIEFARDLQRSGQERREIDAERNRRETRRKEARKQLSDCGKAADGSEGAENILRLLLAEEQGGRCPYSGQMISVTDALNPTITEIDHIFPISRSLDDAQANKLLCRTEENRSKGSRTPHEYLAGNADRWSYLTTTVWPAMERAGWPKAKHRRCCRPNYGSAEDADFTSRQLVDTAYLARAARDYLGLLFGGGDVGRRAVQPVAARASAQIRRGLGIELGQLLLGTETQGPKPRDDHRHHALDALATALATPGRVATLSRWWQQREAGIRPPMIPPPWPGFHEATRGAVAAIVVSHRVQAKLSGALHEDTRLGRLPEPDGAPIHYVKRKPVALLTRREIDTQIRDGAVRAAIKAALAATGGDLKQAVAAGIHLPRKDGTPGPLIRRVRLVMPRASGVLRVHGEKNIHAELGPGTNDHIAIYRDGDRVRYAISTKRESLARVLRGQPAIPPTHPDGGTLVMALRPGDALRRDNDNASLIVVRKLNAAGRIFYQQPTSATPPRPEVSLGPNAIVTEGWRKIAIDPIGRMAETR